MIKYKDVDWTTVPAKIGDKKGIPRTKEDMEYAMETGYVIPAFRHNDLSVELLLDYVDLKLDWYVPSIDSIKFINFIRLCLGTEPENLNPKTHYFFIDCLFQSEEVRPYFEVRNIDYDALKGNTLILSTREFSKALTINTLVLTPDGYTTMGRLEVGDYVISRNGKPTRVVSKSDVFYYGHTTYEMVLTDNRSVKLSGDHLNFVLHEDSNIEEVLTTEELLDKYEQYYIPILDPYDELEYIKIKSIHEIDLEPMQCITVEDKSESFVLQNGIITHNSTLIAYLLLYMADTGELPNFPNKVKFGVYVSDKMDGNVKTTMQTIEALHDESDYLRSRFEYTHFTDSNVEFIRKPITDEEVKAYNSAMAKGLKKEEVPGRSNRRFKVQGIGSSGGRGSRNKLDRPQFAIFDDLVANEKDAYSQAILSAIDSTIEADVGSSLSGNGNFKILIGTAYHTEDPVYKRVTDGTWLPVVFPKAEHPPTKDLPREEFISVWEDRHDYDSQRAEYAKAEVAQARGKPKLIKTINQEYYIRVVSDHERLIPKENIYFEDVSLVWKDAKYFNWYVTTDYTTSSNSDSNNSCQMLWAVDWDERYYLMDLYLRKQEIEEGYRHTNELIMKAISKGANWIDVGVEIDGQQVMHLIGLERYMEKVGNANHLSFAQQKVPSNKKVTWTGIRSKGSGDKLWRLKLFAPNFHANKVVFNKNLRTTKQQDLEVLERELKMTTHSEIKSSDDGLDGISQLALIDVEIPIKRTKDSDENGLFGDYIGDSGNTSSYFS